jgi:hypothetical protein
MSGARSSKDRPGGGVVYIMLRLALETGMTVRQRHRYAPSTPGGRLDEGASAIGLDVRHPCAYAK